MRSWPKSTGPCAHMASIMRETPDDTDRSEIGPSNESQGIPFRVSPKHPGFWRLAFVTSSTSCWKELCGYLLKRLLDPADTLIITATENEDERSLLSRIAHDTVLFFHLDGGPPISLVDRDRGFRLLARLCRTGLVTRRIPMKCFTSFEMILLSRASCNAMFALLLSVGSGVPSPVHPQNPGRTGNAMHVLS